MGRERRLRLTRSESDGGLPETVPAAGPRPASGEPSFPIVAVGASAGGLEAFQRLVAALPPDTGMAFVLILHLAPTHESALAEILGRSARMPVRQAEHDMPVEPNHIYVMPPGATLLFSGGRLQLVSRAGAPGVPHPIDHFMRSLAQALGEQSVGVVLSGTGNDGALGIHEIKSSGGITFAQDDSAQQSTMPRNAVASGGVDFVLAPEAMAIEIARIARHPFARPGPSRAVPVTDDPAIGRLFEILRRDTGIEFAEYRRNTINRRILRRMALHKLERLPDYVGFVATHPREVEALTQDILINVTKFFRDPQAFETVERLVFPRIFESKSRDDTVRVWVLGCSTGQDAYSIAMSFTEYLDARERRPRVQVFATDVNPIGIEAARAGIYPKGIEQDVSAERLRRFFTEVNGTYHVCKPVREMCVFARHDALAQPPFSRLDLVVCRNLLIYLEPVLQRKLLPTLHFALNPGGFLWLGSSETAADFSKLFQVVDARHRIYSRKPGPRSPVAIARAQPAPRPLPRAAARPMVEPDPHREAERLLLTRYVPPSVIVDEDLNVVQFRGDTSPYLIPAQGRASLNLLKMLREGLLVGVRSALHRASREHKPAREENLRVRSAAGEHRVTVVAMPLRTNDRTTGTVVVFEQPGEGSAAQARQEVVEHSAKTPEPPASQKPREEAQRLRQELGATRDYLQMVIEQLEAANEELQAANEESQSSNEELQSVNEELETSKEEIQSTNEELTTVNDELRDRNTELAQSNGDLANLLDSVQMPIVMLDRDLRIRRFTAAAQKLLNLLPGDVGRPFSDIKLNVDAPDLQELFGRALQQGSVIEREVRDRTDRWQWLRVSPYRDVQDRIQGAILMMIDIDPIKRAAERVSESEGRFAALADSAPVLIWVHGLDGCEYVNSGYETFAGVPASALRKQGWAESIHAEDREGYLAAYRDAFARRAPFEYLARFRRADGAFRWMKSIGLPRILEGGDFVGYAGSSVDITELKEAEEGLRRADRVKDEFLATLGHELRNPLAAISNAAYLLSVKGGRANPSALEIIERQTRNMVRIVDDLLDVSRITQGKVGMRLETLNLEVIARAALAATEHERRRSQHALEDSFPAEPVWVLADAVRLEQTLTNLLSNAAKYAPARGRVRLSVDCEARPDATAWAVIRVSDDGPGIDAALLPRVFDLFVQGERDNRAGTGVGIGLALARQLVELHGGTIEARNLKPRGSEFLVRLPAIPPPANPQGSEARSATGVAPRRVLVVDDNADAAQAVQAILRRSGHEVRLAGDGRSALVAALEFAPNVVLMDVGLPDIDGFSVALRLREDARTRDIKLVALSGYGRERDAARAREAGFAAYLMKPAAPEALLRAVAEAPSQP